MKLLLAIVLTFIATVSATVVVAHLVLDGPDRAECEKKGGAWSHAWSREIGAHHSCVWA